MIRPITNRINNAGGARVRSSDVSSRERAALVTALVGPTTLAIAWGLLAPAAGPSTAFADPNADAAAIATPLPKLRTPTEDETLALRHCMEACDSIAGIESPTLIPGSGEIVPDGDDFDEETPAGDFDLRIASIMRDASGKPAVFIDGMLYHEGDAVRDGWSIDSIDLPTRTVRLSNPGAEQPITLAPGR